MHCYRTLRGWPYYSPFLMFLWLHRCPQCLPQNTEDFWPDSVKAYFGLKLFSFFHALCLVVSSQMPMSCELLASSPAASCSGVHLSILWLEVGPSVCTCQAGTRILQLLFFMPWLMMSSSLGSVSSSPAWNHALLRKLLHCCFSAEQTSLEQGLHSHPLAALHPLSHPKRLWWLSAAPLCWKGWSVSKVWSRFSMPLEP